MLKYLADKLLKSHRIHGDTGIYKFAQGWKRVNRIVLVNHLVKIHSYKSYLEIGVRKKRRMNDLIETERVSSVDPDPEANAEYCMTSDDYFSKHDEKFDVIFDLDATSPLREVKDLLNAFKIFKRGNYPNLVSVCISNKNPYYNMIEKNKKEVKIVKKTKFNIYNRQEAPKIYDVNASIYIWKRSSLLKSKNIINSNTGLYVMPKSRSIDIDDIDDFELVKYYMGKKER